MYSVHMTGPTSAVLKDFRGDVAEEMNVQATKPPRRQAAIRSPAFTNKPTASAKDECKTPTLTTLARPWEHVL